MEHRLLVCTVALVLSGCELVGGPDPVGAAVVTEVTVLSAPLRQPDGDRWDGGLLPSDAELYIVVGREAGATPLVSTRNTLNGGGLLDYAGSYVLPFRYRPSGLGREGTTPQEDLGEAFFVELRDADFGGSELMADLGAFTFGDYAPATAGSTTHFTLTSADRSATVRMTVRWDP